MWRATLAVWSAAMAPVRVVIAEDSLIVREGVVQLLRSSDDIDLLAACASLDELYEAVDAHQPDAVVTDIRMPPGYRDEGIQAARHFRLTRPGLGVVVLSHFVSQSYALALFDDGTHGRGYVLKDNIDDHDRLAAAIRTVAAGGSFIDDTVVDALVRARTRLVDSPLETLSARELEVLSAMATGANNDTIAHRLGVTAHSVEKHTTVIFAKLGLDAASDVNRRVKAVLVFLAGHITAGV